MINHLSSDNVQSTGITCVSFYALSTLIRFLFVFFFGDRERILFCKPLPTGDGDGDVYR